MELTLLKGKIHRATVTQCDLDYEGSISVDCALMERAGILPYEQVDVLNITNGNRFTTYAITAPAGSGMIGINGAAARLSQKGDLVIIVAYARMAEAEAKAHQPRVVLVDRNNRALPPALRVMETWSNKKIMPRQDDEKFSNRLDTAAKARAAMLEKAKLRAEEARKKLEETADERKAIAAAREERARQKEEAKRLAAEAAERARIEAEEAKRRAEDEAKLEAQRKKEEELQTMIRQLAEQKAARDARYAARKDRQKKGKR